MMRTIPVTIGGGTSQIVLGRRGENEATEVVFNLASLINQFGDGEPILLIKRPLDSSAYPVYLSRVEDKATWIISATDTAQKGKGHAEIFWYVNQVLAKTVVWDLLINDDIGEPGEVPDPYETWREELLELGAETLANATAAQRAQDKAETAQEAAEGAKDIAVEYGQAAIDSAGNAATSEANALTSETNAKASEQAAALSEENAELSERAAALSEGNAHTSEVNAAASASFADIQAGNAAASASSASGSASAAAASASSASGSATSASGSASAAASSATSASGSASSASGSASAASESAGLALDYAERAEAAAEIAQVAVKNTLIFTDDGHGNITIEVVE